jgi:hypothetical protein
MTKDNRRTLKVSESLGDRFSQEASNLGMTHEQFLDALLMSEVERTETLKVEKGMSFSNIEKRLERGEK